MNSQKQIIALSEAALSLQPSEREAFVASECSNDTELKQAVMTLLASINEEDASLPPIDITFEQPSNRFNPGDSIGNYVIKSELGRGGMGSVYLCERLVEEFRQQVAVKVMHTNLPTELSISRFNEERRILASLRHPFIAQLIDGGTTDDGWPYLVMELVEGLPIDEHCDKSKLTVDERLSIVQKVAQALQSAHQNLVVHGDIKPSNVLITEDGLPKLLDFGIARLLQPVSSETGDTSDESYLALTPDFASPEQISGANVTTASDIYSLGILTYHLVAGVGPYTLDVTSRQSMIDSMQAATTEGFSNHTRKPHDADTLRLAAEARSCTPAQMSKHPGEDLNAVLTKALAKLPDERYVSALQFADELACVREGLPVLARGQSLLYRGQKYLLRYWPAAAAASLAVIALVTGTVISSWQAHIANKRFEDLQGFADTVMNEVHDEIALLPGATAARKKLIGESQHYLDRLAQDAGNDRDLLIDLAEANRRMGDVLGNPNNANLGEVDSSLDRYNKSLAITMRLVAESPNDLEALHQNALSHEKIADMLAWQGQLDTALEHSQYALSTIRKVLEKSPEDQKLIMSLVALHVKRGDSLGHPSFPNVGLPSDALEQYQQAFNLLKPIVLEEEASTNSRRWYALLHERIGTILTERKEFDQALTFFEESLRLRKILAAERASHSEVSRDVAVAHEKIGDLELARGDASASIPFYLQALGMYRQLYESDTSNANAKRTLAIGLENLADAQIAEDAKQDARQTLEEAIILRQQLISQNPDMTRFTKELERTSAKLDQL